MLGDPSRSSRISAAEAVGRGVGVEVDRLVGLVGRPLLWHDVGGRLGQRPAGMSPTSSPRKNTRSCSLSVTSPTMVASRSQRSQASATVGPVGRGHDGQHALLALADHDLPGLHVGLAQRHPVGVDVDAHLALGRHLAGRGGDAGGAQVLQGDELAPAQQVQADLEQLLLGEGVAHLHRRPLLFEGLVELLAGQHARAADAVAARLGAEQDHVVADAGRRAAHDLVVADQAHGHGVHQAVAAVGVLEVHLAADGGDAHAVAVARRCRPPPARTGSAAAAVRRRTLRPGRRRLAAGLGPPAGVARGQVGDLAEAQRVQVADGPGAHGEDVAQDAAHAGGRPLVGLDGRRVVVALDLHGDGQAAADVHDAGVLARTLEHAAARWWGSASGTGRECL